MRAIAVLVLLALGIAIGGTLFSEVRPRSFIALRQCENCTRVSDLAGLVGSVLVQKFPGWIPSKVVETDKTVVVRLPAGHDVHYVIIPKKDLKDIGEFTDADAEYLIDVHRVARHLIEKDGLRKYRLYTNGPEFQEVTYLHFHLTAPRGGDGRVMPPAAPPADSAGPGAPSG